MTFSKQSPSSLTKNWRSYFCKRLVLAYNQNKLEIHSAIWVRIKEDKPNVSNLIKKINLKDNTVIEYYADRQVRKTKEGQIIVQYLQTTTGRAILNYIIQKTLNFL